MSYLLLQSRRTAVPVLPHAKSFANGTDSSRDSSCRRKVASGPGRASLEAETRRRKAESEVLNDPQETGGALATRVEQRAGSGVEADIGAAVLVSTKRSQM